MCELNYVSISVHHYLYVPRAAHKVEASFSVTQYNSIAPPTTTCEMTTASNQTPSVAFLTKNKKDEVRKCSLCYRLVLLKWFNFFLGAQLNWTLVICDLVQCHSIKSLSSNSHHSTACSVLIITFFPLLRHRCSGRNRLLRILNQRILLFSFFVHE